MKGEKTVREITVKISNKNFEKLKKASKADKIVDLALIQFFEKNHKLKVRMLLKRGYKTFSEINLRLSRILEEDADF